MRDCTARDVLSQANDKLPESQRVPASDEYMMAPAVASKMLDAIARTHGFNFEETLTGFKWAGNKVRVQEARCLACAMTYTQ